MDYRIERIECSLSIWVGKENHCQWCNSEIPSSSRRSVWCSSKCSKLWEKNHVWRFARAAARRRDKYACIECGLSRKDGNKIEVNHINPLVGRGYHYGCVHHLDNLETLCLVHHREKTNRQSRERRGLSES
jgi:5-methylcytosine-specific restriction endonuclease McrA